MNNFWKVSIAAFVIAGSSAGAVADPVDEELVIDGREMITKAPAPEGHPFEEVLSGWLFRERETRATEADSFANPGMLYVERQFGLSQ